MAVADSAAVVSLIEEHTIYIFPTLLRPIFIFLLYCFYYVPGKPFQGHSSCTHCFIIIFHLLG